MESSLGLAGDLDDVELIEDIEEAFGLRFSHDELKRCRTVGDVFGLIEDSLSNNDPSANGCATAICFYRMRRALQRLADTELHPKTPIDHLNRLSVRDMYRVIQDDCGFRPPLPIISIWGCVALLLVGLLPLATIEAGLTWWLAAASALPAIAVYRAAPIRLPKDVATFGDLVRIVTARNIGALSKQGARLRTPEAWAALKDIAADHTLLPKGAIGPETLILAPGKAAA